MLSKLVRTKSIELQMKQFSWKFEQQRDNCVVVCVSKQFCDAGNPI